MGYIFRSNIATWTFFVIVYISVTAALHQTLLTDLGLNVLPDKAKINISLDEYISVISTFLSLKDDTYEDVPDLRVYRLENLPPQNTNHPLKMVFPVPTSSDEVESASLRLRLPPQHNDSSVITVKVNQILDTKHKRFLQDSTLYLLKKDPKWCEIDISSAVASWVEGEKNLGLELVCVNCSNNLNPQVAAITALVHTRQKRSKRSLSHERLRTDCSARHQKGKKKKCCRHEMKVTFTKLPFPEMEFIVEPKVYEAGLCHGLCPPNYNFATNHSRIQGLMHQLNKNEAKLQNRKSIVPRTCCAPSKLGDLDILLVNRNEPSKLVVERWENMRVLECACS